MGHALPSVAAERAGDYIADATEPPSPPTAPYHAGAADADHAGAADAGLADAGLAAGAGADHAGAADAGLAAAVDSVAACLGDRDRLSRLDTPALRHRLGLLRRLEGATTAGIAATLAALDRAGGIVADGASSKAEWLKAHTGRSGRDAARVGRLADNLDELPATADALTAGDLTAEAADAIVRASRDGRLGTPDQAETDLLPVATTSSPENLRRHIKRRQHAADGAALLRDEVTQRALRRLSLTQRHDGGIWELHGQVSNEVGVKLRTALDAFDHPDCTAGNRGAAGTAGMSGLAGTAVAGDASDTGTGAGDGPRGVDPDAPRTRTAGDSRRADQRLADALEAMTDRILDAGLAPGTGGIARPHLSIIVDLATIDTDLTRPDGDGPVAPDDPTWAGLAPGETAWGTLLSPQAIRRLLCDANVSRIVTAGPSQVLDVGRANRDWSEPQRRAVNARDRGCRGPNCSRPIWWTHIHHIAWWKRDRGPTNLANGIALCHHCHHLIHDRNWTVTLDPTTAHATWTSPTGQITITRPHIPPAASGHPHGDPDPPDDPDRPPDDPDRPPDDPDWPPDDPNPPTSSGPSVDPDPPSGGHPPGSDTSDDPPPPRGSDPLSNPGQLPIPVPSADFEPPPDTHAPFGLGASPGSGLPADPDLPAGGDPRADPDLQPSLDVSAGAGVGLSSHDEEDPL